MQITGKAIIRADGLVLRTENGATLSAGGINRASERHGGKTYYKEDEVAPSLECNVLHDADTDIIALSGIVNATVEFECDTGQIYILRGAFTAEPVAVDSSTGKAALKMEADSIDKV
jgi:hypothetical protein